ncbi:MAG TPA: SIS domain-containing protein [Gemmatimonadaceae bacterium]|nr:SIS domain-containing protein [Gemmatimonadaceae bacterium]
MTKSDASAAGATADALMELSELAARVSGELGEPVKRAGDLIVESMRHGGKLLACGNGGSAADAQHFVAELVGRMGPERRSLPAVTLSVDPSAVTAIGNDYGYENVFARQVEGLGGSGDVLLAISTSGKSPNILRAIRAARAKGMRVIALAGAGGDPLLAECDVAIHIPSPSTQRVQELHMAVLHAVCAHVDARVLGGTAEPANPSARR